MSNACTVYTGKTVLGEDEALAEFKTVSRDNGIIKERTFYQPEQKILRKFHALEEVFYDPSNPDEYTDDLAGDVDQNRQAIIDVRNHNEVIRQKQQGQHLN